MLCWVYWKQGIRSKIDSLIALGCWNFANLELRTLDKKKGPPQDKLIALLTMICDGQHSGRGAELSALSFGDSDKESEPEINSYLLYGRIRVYSHIPDLQLQKGVTIMPISEGKWVAVSLEFPDEKSN
ncbi:hypothetical protein Droror1_Dr00019186 [Drosera rotundifolia]